MATSAPPAVKRIRIFSMIQYASWLVSLELREVDRLRALCFTESNEVHAWEFVMSCQQWAAVISSQLTVSEQCVRLGAIEFRATGIFVRYLCEIHIC